MKIQQAIPPWFAATTAFVFGAVVGSFLNVCIHRMPRNESIVAPRSHCYACNRTIRWFDNLPLLSFLLLGGRCRDCGARFSMRYWLVELLTAVAFVAIWRQFTPWEAAAYTLFVCGLIAASFIDFEHYIIPDEITVGGVLAGIVCCGIIPSLQGVQKHAVAALWSLAGAATGYVVLWAVVEMGKWMFGVRKVVFEKPNKISLTSDAIRMGDESVLWEEIFSRETDVLAFDAMGIRRAEQTWEKARVRVTWQDVRVDDDAFPLADLGELTATTQEIRIPREAMGFGDVKFIAAIGAFLGPAAIFFVILVSSLVGSVVGLATMLIGKKEWGLKIPYGPYLALAAVIWIFWGSQWASHYFDLFRD